MALVAIKNLKFSGAYGYVWTAVGPEGAIEVPERLAQELLAVEGEQFTLVEKSTKKAEKEVITEVVEQKTEVTETPAAPAAPKRRSTKE